MATPNKLQQQIKSLSMVYWAMASVQVLFGGVIYYLISSGSMGPPDYTSALILQEVALILVPVAMATGYFLFRLQLSKIDKRISLEEKIKKYFTLVLIRAAMFEAAFFYCCVAALLTSIVLFLYIAPVVFLVFVLLRPSPDVISSDLSLTPYDQSKLMNS